MTDGSLRGASGPEGGRGASLSDSQDSGNGSDDDYVPAVPEPVELWGTPQLQAVRRAAHSRDIPEMALLAATLAVLSAEIHPRVVLPDVGKGNGNLNMFVALVARSGGGKSSTINAAQELIGREEAKGINPSSGEGILDAYREWKTGKALKMNPANGQTTTEQERQYLWKHRSCFMVVDEVGTMAGVTDRKGSTLIGHLNTAWSGGRLTTTTADPNRNRDIPAGKYRLAGVVGVQDNTTEVLLGERAHSGIAQRFVFVKTTFPADHEYTDGVFFPGQLKIDLKPECWVNRERDVEESEEVDVVFEGVPVKEEEPLIVMSAPNSVKEETRRRTRESQRDGSEDPLDGHRAYTQLKIAGLLALLHSRMVITEDDWARARALMGLSEQEVARLKQIGQREKAKAVVAAGRMNARRDAASDEERIRRVALSLSRKVASHWNEADHADGCKKSCLKNVVHEGNRQYLDLAIEAAKSRGWVTENRVAADHASHTGARYVTGPTKPGG